MDKLTLDPETERLLEIPEFMDRRRWTPEQWANSERAWQAVTQKAANDAVYQRKRKERALIAAKAEKQAKETAKAERRAAKQSRKARNVQRKQDRNRVVELIDAGHVTIGQMAKASGIPAERLKPAIRWLLRHERISKATPRTYRSA
tara:strand:+ start:19113 stop:19553 length:441 start_codon:yes stop_codon:yes gene_type:complete